MVSALILGVDERHVCEPNKSENVTKVGLLEIKCFSGSALLVGASASGDDDDLFHLQKPARAIGSGAEGFSDPHNLVNPSLQWGRNGEVVHGRSDDNGVCRPQFVDELIRCGEI